MPDDYSATIQTDGTVTVGGSATGAIEKRRDVDWFAVELEAGRTYVIDLEGDDTGGGTLGDTMLRGLYDSVGDYIAGTRQKNGGEGDNARLTFTATGSGTHYIAARGEGRDTGTYTVRVAEWADPDATAAGATDLGDLAGPDGVRQRGSVDGGSDGTDYYRFTLSETKRIELSLRRQDADADLYLEDGNGAVLHSSTKGGTGKEAIEATLQAGTYYVRVAAQEAGDNAYMLNAVASEPEVRPHAPPGAPQQQQGVQSIQTSVSEPDGEDFAADTSTQGRVVVGDSVTGAITRQPDRSATPGERFDLDRDWFAVSLEEGKIYRFDIEGYWTGKGTLQVPDLRGLYDADGTLVAGTPNPFDYANLLDSWHRIYFQADETATYYVAAGGLKQNPGGTYTLSVVEVLADPTDDFTAGTDTTGTVAVGGSVTGKIETAGDRDWFAVTLEKGKSYQIDLSEANWPHSMDPAIRGIYDADGNRLPGTMDDDGGPGRQSQVLFAPGADGTYYVSASASTYWTSRGQHDTGHYTLSVDEVDAM